MSIDAERVLQKIAFIKKELQDMQTLTSEKNREEILNNKFLIKGLKYSLQTAVEAMIDIAFHIAAKKFMYAPENAREAFKILKKNGVITEKEYEIFSSMVGFRNRIVHLYQHISDERVYELSTSELDDFETFITRVKELIN